MANTTDAEFAAEANRSDVQMYEDAIGLPHSGSQGVVDRRESGWLIERYISDRLHFWNAGALAHGRRDGFTDLIDDAVRFARKEDASTVLFRVCDGQGRVAEHVWISRNSSCVS